MFIYVLTYEMACEIWQMTELSLQKFDELKKPTQTLSGDLKNNDQTKLDL